MEAHRVGLPLAVGIAVVAAGAATFALRPRHGLIHPAPVAAEAYFSPSELDRIHDYRGPQRALGIGGLAIEGATLAVLALRPPRRLRRALERGRARPIVAAVAAGAAFAVLLVVVELPVSIPAEQRARDFGLSTQDWGSWTADLLKSTAIGMVMSGLGAAILMGVIRRFPRSWFAVGAGAVVTLSVVFVFFSPVLIEPLFNKFERLPDGPLRSEVLTLAQRAHVKVGEVYRVDASRRTTGVNAYVNGIGHTKRVVLYDTLLRDFPSDQVDSVVAHELGHVKHDDVPRGLLWLAIVAPAGMLVVQRLTERLAPEARAGRAAGPVVLPAAALSIALVSFVLNVPGNAMSRRVEAAADAYSLQLYGHPASMIGLERKLATQNLADPDPPDWVQVLFGTHPKTVERIGYALTWSREH
ncbi:MAG: endopeptidase [Thermoleophilaceae bacterium]|nr:endopeptidase [Thermoleophilaceae bacterium]